MTTKEELNNIPYNAEKDFEKWFVHYRYESMKDFIGGGGILELGCGHGETTYKLAERFSPSQILSIDGSKANIETAKERCKKFGNIEFVHELWNKWLENNEIMFEDVVFCNGLEHLDNPLEVLQYIRSSLQRYGRLHITVPNCISLHRRVGKAAGVISNYFDLTEKDIAAGHKNMYDKVGLNAVLQNAGFDVIHQSGILLKPFSNGQMDSMGLNETQIEALYKVGLAYPDMCGEIYVIAIPAK